MSPEELDVTCEMIVDSDEELNPIEPAMSNTAIVDTIVASCSTCKDVPLLGSLQRSGKNLPASGRAIEP